MAGVQQLTLTLPQALERVRAHAERREWGPAESLCRQLSGQVPDSLAYRVAEQWVGVLHAQQRHGDACTVLHDYLRRVRWLQAAATPAPVLVLYGLDNVARGEVLFEAKSPGQLSFSVNGGHFDSTQLLRHADFAVDRLFLDGGIQPQELARLGQRIASCRGVINSIADPGSEAAALQVAARLCDGLAVPVCNRPQAVLATTRDQVAARLAGIADLRAPKVERYGTDCRQALARRLAGHPQGLILRPENSQTGIGVELVTDEAAIAGWLESHPHDALYATDFHDFRDADGLYRKFRVFAVGGRLWPEHMISAQQWNIHSADRRTAMLQHEALQRAEQAFLADPEGFLGRRAWAALRQAAERLGLDYLGIDFGLTGSEVLLFEANPAMRLNFDHCARFPYLTPHLEAVSQAFCAHVGYNFRLFRGK